MDEKILLRPPFQGGRPNGPRSVINFRDDLKVTDAPCRPDNSGLLCYNVAENGGWVMTRRYKVVLEPNESGGFTVHVPLLPGCISEGDTREEALANIKEPIELYIESLEADGEPVPDGEGVEEAVVEVMA